MKRFIKIFLLIFVLFILPVSLFAFDFDFGLVSYVNSGIEDASMDALELKIDIVPRLSFWIGNNAEIFLSGAVTFDKDKNEFDIIPYFMRSEFSLRHGILGFKIGRINYSDPLSFIASGLFDGLQLNFSTTAGKFSVGAWYTGLLYNKLTEIEMTANDQIKIAGDSIFASQRMLAALEWEHSSVGEIMHLNFSAIGQLDMNNIFRDESTGEITDYNNLYFILKAGIPIGGFLFELGGALELSTSIAESDNSMDISFAGDFNLSWMLPGNLNSRLALSGKLAGGKTDSLEAFIPITTKYYGNIFKHKMSGLYIISLDYNARINRAFGLLINASYFARNDLVTVEGYPVDSENEGFLLGPEFFARIVWSPLSDLQINFGGGVFLPSLGDAGQDEKMQWRAELNIVLDVF